MSVSGDEIVRYAWGMMVLVGIGWVALEKRRGNGLFASWLKALGGMGRPKAPIGFDPRKRTEIRPHAEESDDDA